jgi:hypothetical protein
MSFQLLKGFGTSFHGGGPGGYVPSNGVISSPFSCLTNFFSKKREGNPMFLIFLDLSKFGVLVLSKSFYDFADA